MNHLEPILKSNSSLLDIMEAMKNPYSGLSFITTHQNLVNTTFVSADAVNWLIEHMEGVTTIAQAVKVCVLMTVNYIH